MMLRRGCAMAVRSFSSSSSSSSSAPSTHYHTIQAVPREVVGPRAAAKERSHGRIPSVVFARGEAGGDGAARPVSRKQLLTTERKQIHSLLKAISHESFCCTAFQLQIRAGAGSSCLLDSGWVLPIKVHKDSETGEILNLIFTWVDQNSELPLNIPLVFKGEDLSPGIKKGGYLKKLRKNLRFLCPADNIPPNFEIDVSNMDIGQKIVLDDVDVQPPLKLLSKRKDTLCKVMATKPDGTKSVNL